VVGLDNITGLQTARILAAHRVPVIGVVSDPRHFGAQTRACVEVVASSFADDDLVATLRSIDERLDRTSVLFPCSDVTVAALSRRRDDLPARMRLPLASHDVVDMLMDKGSFATYAMSAGLPVPRTAVLQTRVHAEDAAETLTFPCVVKPPVTSPTWRANAGAKAYPVRTPAELLEVYDRVSGWAPSLVAQEWVEGGEEALLSCNAYFDGDGKALVTFVARKVRQWPPRIGTSASGVECRDDELRDATIALFEGTRFHGLAYLEAKRDSRTGRLAIIEPNVGRPTGRSAIAEAGGVELVYTAYCDALDLPLPVNRQQSYGQAKWLDLRRDTQAAAVAMRRGDLTVREWAGSLRGPKAHAIWSPRDPKPFVVDVTHAFGEGLRMAGRRWSSRRSPAHRPLNPDPHTEVERVP
jgi:predicted ATP-grasp superfamily ATP-dependent carboligase